MYEYDIVRIIGRKEKKTREVTNKKGKVETHVYTEVETFEEFDTRAKKTLNDLASEGWQVLNANYSLPIRCTQYISLVYPQTDFDSAEFVVVLQRSK